MVHDLGVSLMVHDIWVPVDGARHEGLLMVHDKGPINGARHGGTLMVHDMGLIDGAQLGGIIDGARYMVAH